MRFLTLFLLAIAVVGCASAPPDATRSCRPVAVVMGYWPPTNEMLRAFSTDPAHNPGAWQGADWRGLGWDVHAFFPEFPPDGDPTNDELGDPGSVGTGTLAVDYQATSRDFWRIVDDLQPRIVLTTSRGGRIGWELEAIEGGHGEDLLADPASDWASDRHGSVTLPTQASVDPRSWALIRSWRAGVTLPSRLPLAAIRDATAALGRTDVAIDSDGTSGNYLSGFLGLHGLGWQRATPGALAAGHIHVGRDLPVDDARELLEASLEVLLRAHPVAPTCN